MSNQQIPNLPAAIALAGTEQLEAVQAGTSVRINIAQLGTYINTIYPFTAGTGVENDNLTATDLYPLFANIATGTLTTVYTDAGDLNFKPSTGEFSARVLRANNGIVTNNLTVSSDYTIAVGQSGMSAGPITVSPGVTVTVSPGSRWVVL
jgi:hypothetical protein